MASPTSQSTGLIAPTAGTLLYIGKNILNGVVLQPGTTVTLYDNAAGTATGNIVFQGVNAGTSSLDHMLNIGCRFDIGMSIVVTAGTGAVVYFSGN